MCKVTIDTPITFWKFLNDNSIEIPIIQRDYAQGRLGKEHLRKKFLSDIKNALEEREVMKLDFVYGSLENGKFSPLDGQQRLTTLWLLHWYIALISGNLNKDICDVLKKFTYETRISSREFCMNLCKPENFEKYGEYKKEDDRRIVDFITNRTWFYSEWKQDPTIQSMLRMLGGTKMDDKKGNDIIDGLEEVFCKTTDDRIKEYWDCLISDSESSFVFYQLSLDLVSSDDLYIKMNARGKQLTPFENFKADLIRFLQGNENSDMLDDENGIPIKLDTSWTDIFWSNHSKDYRIDDIYFAFLNRFFLSELVSQNTKSGDLEKDVTFCYLYGDESDDSFVGYVGWDKYKGVTIDHLKALKNVLEHYPQKEEIEMYFPEWVSSISDMSFIPKYKEKNKITTLNQKERVVFHAIIKYLKKGKFDSNLFRKWMRVVWNIVENATINGVPGMIGAMRLIDELGEGSHDIYKFLEGDNVKSDFAKEQVKEEIAKAKQILHGESCDKPKDDKRSWEEIIIDAEKYAFFKGAIRFLFQDGEGGVCWENFDKKWENAKKYFGPNGVCEEYDEGCVLLRTLISYFSKWENFTALLYVNSKENWRDKILLNKNFKEQVNTLLSSGEMCDFEKFESIIDDAKMKSIQNQLVKTDLLENLKGECYYLEKNESRLHIYRTNHNNDIYLGDSMHENRILASLIDENRIDCNQRIKETNFFRGEHINFLYKIKNIHIQWYAYPNKNELDVYLMENEWADYKKKQEPVNSELPDNENYYCFSVSPEMIKDPHLFMKKLDCLIAQAYPDSDKSICAECQEKICKSTSE